ncbi:hypothetical protein M409DRAFT_21165 [Zasmidium cellare ATCC 36951]|uniref:Uncharacterized protein n=1 Tax=Zasmidium cellare ATCC 36951 TaxID=1080233 RepID=A0A6A6CMP2_ZASCE|nr:uncharacterized protein M409DRAFT_21165 [Zasmidium cellare ATCC 36951]KAF2168414.1 hypothetical protein M409DRAFT_21165 [Zasmidium cellare ATCC 36951]
MAPATTTTTAEEILLLLREGKPELLGEAASLVTPTTNLVVERVLTAAVDAVANEDGLAAKTMRKVDFLCQVDGDEELLALVRQYLKGKLSRVGELKERLEAVAEEVEDEDEE